MQRSLATAVLITMATCAACDRRDDPRVDAASQGSGSPPGEIVDPSPAASAQADHVPQPRTSDDEAQSECRSGDACDEAKTPEVDR